MAGYLIAEEGSLTGLILRFEDGNEWVIGRDPDEVELVLEDPMVSRKHVICRLTPEGFVLENLSAVNPATQNGKVITEPVLLREGDIVQIGNNFFRFSETLPTKQLPSPPDLLDNVSGISTLSIPRTSSENQWLIKVITGPNTGAEFYMQKGNSYVIGKDPEACDIIFQDLSVSREHAKITLSDEGVVTIEDLNSRNGIAVKGKLISSPMILHSQDTVALGGTSFLVIDLSQSFETVVSQLAPFEEPSQEMTIEETKKPPKDWRDLIIPKKHVILGIILGGTFLALLMGVISLFQTAPMKTTPRHENEDVQAIVKHYSDVQFSYHEGSSKLFLTGHVSSSVDKQELLYQLGGLTFLTAIEDTVVIDEYVWGNMNALLMTNPAWQGISIHAPTPGKFVVRGYLPTLEQAQALADYLNMNFPYLDRLDNQVIVESNLTTQIESLLVEKGFNNVSYQLIDGELVLSGRVGGKDPSKFETLVKEFRNLPGIRIVKNFTIYTTEENALVDLSSKYKVAGFSKRDGESQFVVINGKILTVGDTLDGMVIMTISSSTVFLEKDGLKFRINYNLQ